MDHKAAVFIAMGFELVAVIIVLLYIGQWADERFGLKGFGVIIALVMALTGWLVHLLTVARQLAKGKDSGDTRPK